MVCLGNSWIVWWLGGGSVRIHKQKYSCKFFLLLICLMKECNICKLPLKEIDNGYVCSNGHIVTKIQEADDEEGWTGTSRVEKKKVQRQRIGEILPTLEPREVFALVGLRYLQSLLKEFGITKPAFVKYRSFYYALTLFIDKLPDIGLGNGYKKIAELFTFLVKRDLEEKKGRLYILSDFTRKFEKENCAARYFYARRDYFRSHYLRAMVDVPLIRYFNITSITKNLQGTFPDKKEYCKGMYGVLNENGLEKICAILGLTKTKRIVNGFNSFIEAIDIIRFTDFYKKFIFSEVYIGAYLLIYAIVCCSLKEIDNQWVIVEKISDVGEGSVVQEFFCKEINMCSLKQFNYYLNAMEMNNGDSPCVFNPLEFPSPKITMEKSLGMEREMIARVSHQIEQSIGADRDSVINLAMRITSECVKIGNRLVLHKK